MFSKILHWLGFFLTEEVSTEGEYIVIARLHGVFTEFDYGIAQRGDPKLSLIVKCPKGTMYIGGWWNQLSHRQLNLHERYFNRFGSHIPDRLYFLIYEALDKVSNSMRAE